MLTVHCSFKGLFTDLSEKSFIVRFQYLCFKMYRLIKNHYM